MTSESKGVSLETRAVRQYTSADCAWEQSQSHVGLMFNLGSDYDALARTVEELRDKLDVSGQNSDADKAYIALIENERDQAQAELREARAALESARWLIDQQGTVLRRAGKFDEARPFDLQVDLINAAIKGKGV